MKATPREPITLFTIGHSRHTAEQFVALLRAHAIGQLVDVRSQPVSKWAAHFDKLSLAQLLRTQALGYVFLGHQLGGRPAGREFYRADGSVDYALRAGATDFQAGVTQLVELARGRRTAILCAEEDPRHCHRRRLVTPALRREGLEIFHIRGDSSLEADMEDPPSTQFDLFGER